MLRAIESFHCMFNPIRGGGAKLRIFRFTHRKYHLRVLINEGYCYFTSKVTVFFCKAPAKFFGNPGQCLKNGDGITSFKINILKQNLDKYILKLTIDHYLKIKKFDKISNLNYTMSYRHNYQILEKIFVFLKAFILMMYFGKFVQKFICPLYLTI